MNEAPRLRNPHDGEAGFTLIEMMIATVLMVFVLTALATITAQWLPNWNHGMQRVALDERFAYSLNRIVGDLSVAEFVPVNNTNKLPFFDGAELGVAFVRTAVGPNSHPGLEFVRFRELADKNGPALVREQAMFSPLDPGAQIRYSNPTVLIAAPFRVMFSYASVDGNWQPTWQKAVMLPAKIKVTVRDGVTQQQLAISTAALVHIDIPVDCVKSKSVTQCLQQLAQAAQTGGNNQTPAAPAAPASQ
jgi:general secretion pathway protein J